ncbi:hypothetical protein [Chromohalobacter canadensis]|uniref:hypothetical protein n=1 Tax=Chromohalobacter canadensis TaxID=141389 RepID=UPI00240F584F|nr:hypothetical protein [Chromohalobacter canadensis]
MDFSSIGNAVDSAAEATSGLFDSVATYTTNAFDWLDNNPTAANVIGGLASGAASYYADQQAQEARFDFERDMYERQREDQMVNPGTIEGYGSHVGQAKKGLLTNGMIAGGE